jgi:hypothetical protein
MATGTSGRGRGRDGKFTRTTDSAERDHRAAELHGQGWSYQRIADELGFSHRGKAHEAVQRAFADIPTEGTEEAKRLDLERLDRLIEWNWEVMTRPHLAHSNGKVVRQITGIMKDSSGQLMFGSDGKPLYTYADVLDDGPGQASAREIRMLIEARLKIHGYGAPAKVRVETITAEMIEDYIAKLEAQVGPDDAADPGDA